MPVSLRKQCRAFLHREGEGYRQCVKTLGHDWSTPDDPHRSSDGRVWGPSHRPSTQEEEANV